MRILTTNLAKLASTRVPESFSLGSRITKSALLASLLALIVLSGCGTEAHKTTTSLPPLTLSGNWQFTMAAPADTSFMGGLQGGFLLQGTSGSATGSVAYSVSLPNASGPCNSGSAATTGTIKGQNITVTAVAGTQTFALTGTVSFDGSTMSGTYNSTAGTAADGSPCGTAQTGLQWSAVSIPPLTGSLQGTFYSAGGTAGLADQEFVLTGGIKQAANTGASSAIVTGNLSFLNAASNATNYPCIAAASVNGEISGNSVNLQIMGSGGSAIGQIGASPTAASSLGTVTFNPAQGTYVLQSLSGFAYAVYSSACGGGTLQNPADYGSICLALNSSSACTQPIAFAPNVLSFSSQVEGTTSSQTIALTNTSTSTLSNLTLTVTNNSGVTVFGETDLCGASGGPSKGEPFILSPSQTCFITISYAPQCAGSCSKQTATLFLHNLSDNTIFTVPISGTPTQGAQLSNAALPLSLTVTAGNSHSEATLTGSRPIQDLDHHAEID
jgi:hypothetical protein